MITTLFFVFFALVVFHFIYDGILAPSLRFNIKLKLFEMRDRLRRLKIENEHLLSDELFKILQDDINKQIRLNHKYNVVGVFEAIRFMRDNAEIEKRVKMIETLVQECELEEVKAIYNQSIIQVALAFVANAGGWVIYLMPFVVLLLVSLIAWSKMSHFVIKILQIPDEKLDTAFS